jgi:hypothetical protein
MMQNHTARSPILLCFDYSLETRNGGSGNNQIKQNTIGMLLGMPNHTQPSQLLASGKDLKRLCKSKAAQAIIGRWTAITIARQRRERITTSSRGTKWSVRMISNK